MGFAIRRANISGLQDFLLRLNPSSSDASEDPFLAPFWEEMFQCSLGVQAEDQNHNAEGKPPCSGTEDLRSIANIYSDVSQLRISYNVYKAVYAIAHALHTFLKCDSEGPNNRLCEKHNSFATGQVAESLQNNVNKACVIIFYLELDFWHCFNDYFLIVF